MCNLDGAHNHPDTNIWIGQACRIHREAEGGHGKCGSRRSWGGSVVAFPHKPHPPNKQAWKRQHWSTYCSYQLLESQRGLRIVFSMLPTLAAWFNSQVIYMHATTAPLNEPLTNHNWLLMQRIRTHQHSQLHAHFLSLILPFASLLLCTCIWRIQNLRTGDWKEYEAVRLFAVASTILQMYLHRHWKGEECIWNCKFNHKLITKPPRSGFARHTLSFIYNLLFDYWIIKSIMHAHAMYARVARSLLDFGFGFACRLYWYAGACP